MAEIEMMHMTTNKISSAPQDGKPPFDILQHIKNRKQVMKQAAIDLVEGVGLPQEAWQEVLPTLFAYSDPQDKAFVEQEDFLASIPVTPKNSLKEKQTAFPTQSSQQDFEVILQQLDNYIVLMARRFIPTSTARP